LGAKEVVGLDLLPVTDVDKVESVMDLPYELPALGYHAVDNGVREAICVHKSAEQNSARRERRRRTVTVSLVETLKN
jgi:hypothetical protein